MNKDMKQHKRFIKMAKGIKITYKQAFKDYMLAKRIKKIIPKRFLCWKVAISRTNHPMQGHENVIIIDSLYRGDNNMHRTAYFTDTDEFYFMYGSYTVVNKIIERMWRAYNVK